MQRIWVVTFPQIPVLSKTGFLEVALVLDTVPAQDQPFWMLLPWGDSPLKGMVQ
jgi:hypothetical protein